MTKKTNIFTTTINIQLFILGIIFILSLVQTPIAFVSNPYKMTSSLDVWSWISASLLIALSIMQINIIFKNSMKKTLLIFPVLSMIQFIIFLSPLQEYAKYFYLISLSFSLVTLFLLIYIIFFNKYNLIK